MVVKCDSQSALLVIDMQQGFLDPAWGPRNNLDAEQKIAALMRAFRSAALPIVHIRHESQNALGHFRPGTSGNDPMPLAAEQNGEPVIRKAVNSAFIGTPLEQLLRTQGIGKLVIVGLTTNHCVSTTARMAANLGFGTYVVADATAAFEQVAVDGTRRNPEQVHAAALSDLNGEFAAIVDTPTVLRAIGF